MNLPDFKESKVLALITGIARKWGGAEKILQTEAALRKIADHQQYLRDVSKDRAGSQNLVAAAILGMAIAGNVEELASGERASRLDDLRASHARLLAAAEAVTFWTNRDGSPCDGFRFREELANLKAAIAAAPKEAQP